MTEYRVTEDRFLPPWKVEEESACFVVRDRDGQALAHVFFENEARRLAGSKPLKRDEARRIAGQLAKLPKLLKKRSPSGPRSALRSRNKIRMRPL